MENLKRLHYGISNFETLITQRYACYLAMILCCCLCACNTTKYVPDGSYLLNKIDIQSDAEDIKPENLKSYIRQQPNFKMFGLVKTQLHIYNWAGRDSTKWFNRFLKKLGDPPVIYDSTLVDRTSINFQKYCISKGYLHAEVNSTVKFNDKKANVEYQITGHIPYRIGEFSTEISDSVLYSELYERQPSSYRLGSEPASLRNSLIRKDMLFDRSILDQERERISNLLKMRGFYAFEKNFISYDADSVPNNYTVNLALKIHPYPEILPNGMFAEVPHRRYYINDVFIYLDYNPLVASAFNSYQASDSIVNGKYTIYYPGKKPSIRPGVLYECNYLTPRRAYSQLREETTYSSYASLPALSNISIRFEEFIRNDSSFLDTHILTMPAKNQGVSFSVEGTNSAGDFGVASSMNYNHRNLFRNAEVFNLKVRGAYEAISGNVWKDYFLQLGTEVSLRFPKFIFPFLSRSFARTTQASTEFSGSYDFQTRPEYDRRLLAGGIRYHWQKRGPKTINHSFKLLDINYISFPYIDTIFSSKLLDNARLFSYSNQFIVGMGYNLYYTTFNPMQKQQRDVRSFRLSVESAGNTLYGGSRLFNATKDERGVYLLFNNYYSQFVKGDFDWSRTVFIDKQNAIAWRIGAGLCYPYGNSEEMPFEKRYYSGGANSVRGWSVRTLGPGAYQTVSSTSFYEQSGDIRLDLNVEYRSRLFWKLETTLFLDAGNIWTIKDYPDQPKAAFKLTSFYKEIAMAYGLGLRLDFDFFLIRLDMGWKAYDPANIEANRWVIKDFNFKNNFAWHFAIGYPF